MARAYFSNRMRMIEKCADVTDHVIGKYILKGVTEGLSYDTLNAIEQMPCCRDTYYILYRKFFWLLDKARQ